MKRLLLLVVLALLLGAVLPGSGMASHLTATCGSTISSPGTYDVLHNCSGPGITISSGDVELRLNGHTLNGGSNGTGIDVENVSGVRIEGGGEIENYSLGLSFSYVTDSQVEHVKVLNSTGQGVAAFDSNANVFKWDVAADSTFHGFTLNGSNDNVLENDVSTGNGADGLYLASSSGNSVAYTVISGNGNDGVDVDDIGNGPANDNRIEHDTTNGNFIGGIVLEAASSGDRVAYDRSHDNGSDDVYDGHGNCASNSWHHNRFGISSPACIR